MGFDTCPDLRLPSYDQTVEDLIECKSLNVIAMTTRQCDSGVSHCADSCNRGPHADVLKSLHVADDTDGDTSSQNSGLRSYTGTTARRRSLQNGDEVATSQNGTCEAEEDSQIPNVSNMVS